MRTAIMLGAFVGLAAALAACKGGEPIASSGGAVPATTSASSTTSGTAVSPSAVAAPPVAAPSQWVMPNLVGSNLQAAQDQIQAVTGNPIFITLSHDATGRGRNQVLDSNWKVCSQNVAPGAPFTEGTKIDFGAVKLAEKCP